MAKRSATTARTTYATEVAISAVSYDACLVTDLTQHLTSRLGAAPRWIQQPVTEADAAVVETVAEDARVLVLLHQRLSQHDAASLRETAGTRERLRSRPKSLCVILLDDEALPEWLKGARTCALSTAGVSGAAEFILDAVGACGGKFAAAEVADDVVASVRGWHDGPRPFLDQPRASSSLRVQLEAIASELRPHVRQAEERLPDRVAQLHSLPNRLIMQIGSVGLSFSWVAGTMGSVTDGRLMVIEWSGLQPKPRGSVLESAVAVRECVYRPEATDATSWRWRADAANGEAYSTAHLTQQWVEGASHAIGHG